MAEAAIVVRRRKWKPEEKAALLAEIEAEGGRVSVVARRHGLSQSLLYNWRAALRAAAAMRGREFISLGELDRATPMLATPDQSPPSHGCRPDRVGMIEIDLPGGVRVRVDSEVKATALREVFQALRETA
jgi:transposase